MYINIFIKKKKVIDIFIIMNIGYINSFYKKKKLKGKYFKISWLLSYYLGNNIIIYIKGFFFFFKSSYF